MSEAITPAEARHVAAHRGLGFIRHYIFSTDHKMIGKQFLTLGLMGLMMGGMLALLVRWELAWPANGPTGGPGPRLGGGSMDNPPPPRRTNTPAGYNTPFPTPPTPTTFFPATPPLVGC